MNNQRDEIEIDLRELFYVLKKKVLVILLTAVVFAGAAGAYSFFLAKPVYEATSKLYILTQSTSITSLADIQMGSSLALDYVELIKSRPVVNKVKRNLNIDIENEEILDEMLTIENPVDTRILNINIQGDDRTQVMEMANEFAMVAKRQISEIMQTDEPTVAEVAVVPDDPIKPEKTRNIMLGFLLGAFLTAFITIVLHIMNDNIRTEEDVERYLELNMLAAIPYESGAKHGKKKGKVKKKKGDK